MAKQNKEYVYVDCYQCDENGKSSPWKRKHLDDVPKWQHEEAKDFNCFATVQKYANEKKTEGEDFLAPLYFDLDYSENPAVMMKIGQYTGEGMAIGIEKMVGQVQSASEQLANGITAPVTYNSGNSPVQEVQSTLSDVPALAGNIPVSPTGSSKAETLKKEIKLVIEKIILNDTGDKDKKQLVKELLEELIEELKGADEVISSADLGVLL